MQLSHGQCKTFLIPLRSLQPMSKHDAQCHLTSGPTELNICGLMHTEQVDFRKKSEDWSLIQNTLSVFLSLFCWLSLSSLLSLRGPLNFTFGTGIS